MFCFGVLARPIMLVCGEAAGPSARSEIWWRVATLGDERRGCFWSRGWDSPARGSRYWRRMIDGNICFHHESWPMSGDVVALPWITVVALVIGGERSSVMTSGTKENLCCLRHGIHLAVRYDSAVGEPHHLRHGRHLIFRRPGEARLASPFLTDGVGWRLSPFISLHFHRAPRHPRSETGGLALSITILAFHISDPPFGIAKSRSDSLEGCFP